jgi:hypothetical protein
VDVPSDPQTAFRPRWLVLVHENDGAPGGTKADSGSSDLIFTTAHGEPINEEYLVKKHFKPILREAGLPATGSLKADSDLSQFRVALTGASAVAPRLV